MFNMKIEQQMNMNDRTLLLGIPVYDAIPNEISVDGKEYNVVGVSLGVKQPYLSLEIQKTDKPLKNKIIAV